MTILDVYPKTSGKLTIKKNRNDYFIRDISIKKDLVANEDLVLILKECGGDKNVREILNIISDEKKIPQDKIIGRSFKKSRKR